MSAIVKTKLKGARDAIGKKDYDKARDAALQVLEYDPDNYMAYVHHKFGSIPQSIHTPGKGTCFLVLRIEI